MHRFRRHASRQAQGRECIERLRTQSLSKRSINPEQNPGFRPGKVEGSIFCNFERLDLAYNMLFPGQAVDSAHLHVPPPFKTPLEVD